MGPYQRTPFSCDRAIAYSGFSGSIHWVRPLEISWTYAEKHRNTRVSEGILVGKKLWLLTWSKVCKIQLKEASGSCGNYHRLAKRFTYIICLPKPKEDMIVGKLGNSSKVSLKTEHGQSKDMKKSQKAKLLLKAGYELGWPHLHQYK